MATDSDFKSFCLVEGEKRETTNKKKKKCRVGDAADGSGPGGGRGG